MPSPAAFARDYIEPGMTLYQTGEDGLVHKWVVVGPLEAGEGPERMSNLIGNKFWVRPVEGGTEKIAVFPVLITMEWAKEVALMEPRVKRRRRGARLTTPATC